MNTFQRPREVQQRIARHYLDTLRRANTAIHRGRENRTFWYKQVEQDWGQIRHWQSWSASADDGDSERSRLCVDFSIAGLDVLQVRQSPPERITWLQQALQVAQRLNDGPSERTVEYELGHVYILVGAVEDARQSALRLLQVSEAARDDFNTGRAWYVLGLVNLHVGALGEAETALQKSIALLERVGAEAELGRALQGMGRVAMYRGESQRAHDLFLRYLGIVERSDREAELAPAYLTMNHVLLQLRDYSSARVYVERALQVCQHTGFQRLLPLVWLSLGATEVELDDLESASQHFEKGIADARLMQAKSALIEMLWNLADVRMRQANYAAAYHLLQEALVLARENRILYLLCEITAALSRWHLDQKQVEEARDTLREACTFALELKSDNFLTLVLIPAMMLWRQTNRAEQAAQWAGLAVAYSKHVSARLFDPLCAKLKQDLGTKRYRRAFEQGKLLSLDDVVPQILVLLA